MKAKLYNAIVFVGDKTIGNEGYIKYRKITSLEKFKLFLNGKYPQWVFSNVYDNETKVKLGVIKRVE